MSSSADHRRKTSEPNSVSKFESTVYILTATCIQVSVLDITPRTHLLNIRGDDDRKALVLLRSPEGNQVPVREIESKQSHCLAVVVNDDAIPLRQANASKLAIGNDDSLVFGVLRTNLDPKQKLSRRKTKSLQ